MYTKNIKVPNESAPVNPIRFFSSIIEAITGVRYNNVTSVAEYILNVSNGDDDIAYGLADEMAVARYRPDQEQYESITD